jgi:hypothetical protein
MPAAPNLNKSLKSMAVKQLWESGASSVVCKLAPHHFFPLATEGLHLKNYLLWSLLMKIFKKNSLSSMVTTNKIIFGPSIVSFISFSSVFGLS